MDDRDRNTEYSEIQVSGQASVHAGSAIYYNIQNVYVNNPSGFVPQQLFREPEISHQPNLPPLEHNLSNSTNVASPSQSSDSTGLEYEHERVVGVTSTMPRKTRPPYSILQTPSRNDNRCGYFLEGDGLARHVVLRHVGYMAGPNAEVRRFTYERRDGYFVFGRLLQEEQIADLKRLSREHEREKRVDRHMTMRD
ncbi:hypothetical protein H2198_009932 [Neophaeococcomyces mojaviensis]|uniref:Uncharacterized protein n=1 Tax=Neophaeococcomyces mojaviensis TaxID=3383035 RepID=A0ACC2ZT61_9EURO|nr:hypothetical protein H2198_009932 [Knufia sp. JES_112]